MEDLQADVMIDILSRLSVKTIIHCKCVCKKWRNLVLDSYFVNLHLSRSPTGLIIHDDGNVSQDPGIFKWVEIEDKVDHHHLHHGRLMSLDLNLAPILQNSQLDQVGSVNGLICLWQYYPEVDNTYICNPITREYMILPRHQYYREHFSVIVYGFGVSSTKGEYKVVRTSLVDNQSSEPSVLKAEVYTLGTDRQWRSLGRVPYQLNKLYGYHAAFLNGYCHWIVCDQDGAENLCSFDLDKETFQVFPLPTNTIQGSWFHSQSLAVLKGCLCKIDTYVSHITIWAMKEYGINKSWHKEEISVDVTSLTCVMRQPMYMIEGLKDRSILMVGFNHKLLAYCPESNTVEDTEILDRCISVVTYHPSFLKLQNFDSESVHMF